jgi:hypothetical protein
MEHSKEALIGKAQLGLVKDSISKFHTATLSNCVFRMQSAHFSGICAMMVQLGQKLLGMSPLVLHILPHLGVFLR